MTGNPGPWQRELLKDRAVPPGALLVGLAIAAYYENGGVYLTAGTIAGLVHIEAVNTVRQYVDLLQSLGWLKTIDVNVRCLSWPGSFHAPPVIPEHDQAAAGEAAAAPAPEDGP